MEFDADGGADYPQLHQPAQIERGAETTATVRETHRRDPCHPQTPPQTPLPRRTDHRRRSVRYFDAWPTAAGLETGIPRLPGGVAAVVERFTGPVETADHTPPHLGIQSGPAGVLAPHLGEHPHQVITGQVPIPGELRVDTRVVLPPPRVGAPPRLKTRVVHLTGPTQNLIQPAMLSWRELRLQPQSRNLTTHRIPTYRMNRPGFPGDSISWEIMESWEDRSCIHRRCGSVLSGWCWSIGENTALSGRRSVR